jgi:hypothetical protein
MYFHTEVAGTALQEGDVADSEARKVSRLASAG